MESPDGQRFDRASHILWTVTYPSDHAIGRGAIVVEVTMRPVLRPIRRLPLRQLLTGSVANGYQAAHCWALAAEAVRAEKVRAAYTRTDREIRDFSDLGLLASVGADLSSPEFVALVDAKLAEMGAAPLAEQPTQFGLTDAQKAARRADIPRKLVPMLRRSDMLFDLDPVLDSYDTLWWHLLP